MRDNKARIALVVAAFLSGSYAFGGDAPKNSKEGIPVIPFSLKSGRSTLKESRSPSQTIATQIHMLPPPDAHTREINITRAMITKILHNQNALGKELSKLIPPMLLSEIQDFTPDDSGLERAQKLEALALHMKARFPYQKAIFALYQEAFRVARPYLDSPEVQESPQFSDLMLSTAQLGLYSGIALVKHLTIQLEGSSLKKVDWKILDSAAQTMFETERLASRVPEALEALPADADRLEHYQAFFPTTSEGDLREAIRLNYREKAEEISRRLALLKFALGANGLIKALQER